MKTDKHFTWLFYVIAAACAGFSGGDRWWLSISALATLLGIQSSLAYHRISLTWQSPDLYRYAGLYLKAADKRYRLVRFGKM
ncbi:MAG: hypothetical protein H7293_00555 [Candidatus Saccharibacteria bacterium]|nr:hypothetical protein [Rhodoferax sp.]